jgi:hypothetical protein
LGIFCLWLVMIYFSHFQSCFCWLFRFRSLVS